MLVVRFRNHKSFMINNNNNKICKLRIHFNFSHHEIHQISFIIIEKISITKAAPIWKNHSYAGCLMDLAAFHAPTPWSEQKNKGSKFLKKLWCMRRWGVLKIFVRFAPTKGYRSRRQLSNLFTVANSHYQLS